MENLSNQREYVLLLKEILNNSIGLKESAIILLQSQLKDIKNERQFQVIHSQHFLYLCMEELGKFFLILGQYPQDLNKLRLKELGFYDHNTKIKALITFIKKIQLKNNKISLYPVNEAVKIFRNFKEPNVYIDYKNEIIRPIARRGTDTLDNLCKVVINSINLASLVLKDFEKDANFYI